MRSMPLRRSDQTHFACGVESGVMSPPTARQGTPSVLSAHRSMLQRTTGAPLRDVGWDEAVCVHTLRQSAQTVEVLMAQGRMPAWPRRSPSMHRGGGGHRPQHGGIGRGRSLALRLRTPRRRAHRRSRWRRWEERSTRPLGSSGRRGFCFFSFYFLSVMGETTFDFFSFVRLCFLADLGRRRCCETPIMTA